MDRQYFEDVKGWIFSTRKPGEHIFLELAAEQSQFVRINGAKIRQGGTVRDRLVSITMLLETNGALRRASRTFNLTGISHEDRKSADDAVARLRAETACLPVDTYAKLPENHGESLSENPGHLLSVDDAADSLLANLSGYDVAGLYSAGPITRAVADSAGTSHWYSSETFTMDYSLYTASQRAVKDVFAGNRWDQHSYEKALHRSKTKLSLLEKQPRRIERGAYRAYLEPAATAELIHMFSWGTIGEAAIRQGDSPLRRVRSGEARFSKLFSLNEDFTKVPAPRFNDLGELAPEVLPLINKGELVNTLVSSRTSKEYGVAANGATFGEAMRAPYLSRGGLREADALKRLSTGVYLSNLHYLNWSDQHGGRVTGMTRYACFWVENGEIIAPIENMRFDDSIFSLLGSALEDLTQSLTYFPDSASYGMRSVGGIWVPGMLLSEMKFTI